MIDFLLFLTLAAEAYFEAKKGHVAYCAAERNGIPRMAIFVGLDREAWRITQRAIEEFDPLNH